MKEIKINKLDETVYYDKAKSGLEIYMLVNEKVSNYYATLNVLYGSCDTKFKINSKVMEVPNGVAHFLEHINFNEKDGTKAEDFFDKTGTAINASTTFDYTSYEIFGTTNILENVNHLLDYVQTSYITKEIVEKEKGIIIEEANMDSNRPANKFYYANNRIVFHNNKRINEITGNVNDIKKITVDDLNLVYNSFYHPKNMFIVITGNFNPYELSTSIKENQDKKKFNDYNKPKVIKDKEEVTVVKEYQVIKDNVEIPKICVNYKMSRKKFKSIEEDVILLTYLNIILNANFGQTSDFKEELMEKELITRLSTNSFIEDDLVIISINAETKYPNEIIDMIKENMNKISITKERLARRIKSNISYLITMFDDIEDINDTIQGDVVKYNKIINNKYNIIKGLNVEDANYIIKHIDLKNSAVLVQEAK